ncbi:hypothetical protein R6Q59_029421 [Mikania micrantha]
MIAGSFSGTLSSNYQITRCISRRVRLGIDIKASQIVGCEDEFPLVNRRVMIGLSLSASSLLLHSPNVESAGLPPQEIPKLCDESCEKELENNEKLNKIIKDILKEKEENERLNGIIAELEAEKEKHKTKKDAMSNRMSKIEDMLKTLIMFG